MTEEIKMVCPWCGESYLRSYQSDSFICDTCGWYPYKIKEEPIKSLSMIYWNMLDRKIKLQNELEETTKEMINISIAFQKYQIEKKEGE